jgi:hypothetical protein
VSFRSQWTRGAGRVGGPSTLSAVDDRAVEHHGLLPVLYPDAGPVCDLLTAAAVARGISATQGGGPSCLVAWPLVVGCIIDQVERKGFTLVTTEFQRDPQWRGSSPAVLSSATGLVSSAQAGGCVSGLQHDGLLTVLYPDV